MPTHRTATKICDCALKCAQTAALLAAIAACFTPVGPFHGFVGLFH